MMDTRQMRADKELLKNFGVPEEEYAGLTEEELDSFAHYVIESEYEAYLLEQEEMHFEQMQFEENMTLFSDL